MAKRKTRKRNGGHRKYEKGGLTQDFVDLAIKYMREDYNNVAEALHQMYGVAKHNRPHTKR